jgi:hypothetical protein
MELIKMAFTNQINGRQIRDLVIKNNHVAADAAIAETKLAINWTAHYQEALESKKILDYVQLNNVPVGDGGSVAVTLSKIPSTGPTVKGVVDSQPVLIRDRATGQPIEVAGSEVFGKLTMTTGSFDYTVSFFTGVFGGTETAVILANEFPQTTAIDIQYPARFDLYDINESFAMNEKFVDGAADVTEIENLRQLAKDIYGSGWGLDNDAAANGLTVDGVNLSIYDHLVRIHADSSTAGSINKEIKDQVIDPLASVDTGKGASLIGIKDSGNKFTAINVEDALQEVVGKSDAVIDDVAKLVALTGMPVDSTNLDTFTGSTIADNRTIKGALQDLETALNTLQNSGGAEVAATHTRESNYTNTLFSATDYVGIENRLIDIETVIDAAHTCYFKWYSCRLC